MSMCARSAPALVSPNHTLTSAAPQSGGTTPNRYVSHPPQPLTHAQPKPAAGGGRTQCLSGRCQRPEVRRLCPGEQQKGTRRPGEHGRRLGQCVLQFQRLVFFSYSWPCPRALWPPAISQDPAAKTVDGGCCGVQRGSRPAPHSALTPIHKSAHASAHRE